VGARRAITEARGSVRGRGAPIPAFRRSGKEKDTSFHAPRVARSAMDN
jgi:hypothetical protein